MIAAASDSPLPHSATLPETGDGPRAAPGPLNAENALRALTSGQVDAIIDPEGQAYLLRPAQENLRRNEQRLQAILDGAADAITVVDRGGVILSQSRAAKWVLGYEPSQLVGKEHSSTSSIPMICRCSTPPISTSLRDLRSTPRWSFRHRDPFGSWIAWSRRPVGQLRRGDSRRMWLFPCRPVTTAAAGDASEPCARPPAPRGRSIKTASSRCSRTNCARPSRPRCWVSRSCLTTNVSPRRIRR